jgi:ABC-type multidrug transport system ATPase subunit
MGMMSKHCQRINLNQIGKRYNRDWIFRGVDLTFERGNSYALTGSNGSGKSTLLQLIGGMIQTSEGSMEYSDGSGVSIPLELIHQEVSMAAPYLELVEEMTAMEFLDFHQSFKKLSGSKQEILNAVQLENAAHKQIRYYSSGMKQRLKLAQAIFSEGSILLLDEPTTNLDQSGINLYEHLLNNQVRDRILIISSNEPREYQQCNQVISVEYYKKLEQRIQ